jgi:hypothetical protein
MQTLKTEKDSQGVFCSFIAIIHIFNHMHGLRGLNRPTLYTRKKNKNPMGKE